MLRICKEKFTKEETGEPSKLATPGKKRRIERRVTNLDSFQEDAIRREIYAYYSRKEHPTIKKLHATLVAADLFQGSKSSLLRVVKELGFRYKSICGRKILMERQDITAWRCRFLREIIQTNFDDIVWLDETWVNAGHSLKKGWTDDTISGSMAAPIRRGKRIIVAHAGTSEGFIPNCLLLFSSNKTSDYHEEMNHKTFVKWFENSVLRNLRKKSVIVMDNAPYHSVIKDKAPTKATKKSDIVSWLEKRKIPFVSNLTRAELLELVSQHKPQFPVYLVDEMAKNYGHKVLRLPPYHCHFNAIELIWAQVKRHIAAENKKFTVTEVERLLKEAVEKVRPEDWKNVVKHVNRVIQEAWSNEGILQQCVEDLIISVTTSSDTDSSSDSDSELSGVFPLSE